MNKYIIFTILGLVYSNVDINTKQFTLYKDTATNEIDLYEFINNFIGDYKVELISVTDIQFSKKKKILIEQCDLKFKLRSLSSVIDVSRCSEKMNYNGSIYINEESSMINIDASKYLELSCTLTFWITGIFIDDNINMNTEKNGLLTESYPNGNRKIEYTFSGGIKNGVQKKWYNNGQLEILYNYIDGKLEGLQKKWYQNGTIKGEWNYREDKLNGIIKEWYPNKQIKFIKEYNNGELVEVIENNDLDGNPY